MQKEVTLVQNTIIKLLTLFKYANLTSTVLKLLIAQTRLIFPSIFKFVNHQFMMGILCRRNQMYILCCRVLKKTKKNKLTNRGQCTHNATSTVCSCQRSPGRLNILYYIRIFEYRAVLNFDIPTTEDMKIQLKVSTCG